MKSKFYTRDAEAGNIIDSFNTYEDAEEAIRMYEEEDKQNGDYQQNFYEIEEVTIEDIAQEYGLDYCDTTTGMNGYPQELKLAVVGFGDAGTLRIVKEKYGMKAVELRKKEGHSLWTRSRAGYVEPYDLTRVFDDGIQFFNESDIDAAVISMGESIANGEMDIDDIVRRINLLKEVNDTLEYIEDDEFIDLNESDIATHKIKAMGYEYDGTYYTYGLIF